MPMPFDNPALFGAGGCGAHQQVYGAIVVGGEEIEPLVFLDFKNGVYTANGSASTLEALVEEEDTYGAWDPNTIVNGTGLVAPGGTTNPSFIGDALDLLLSGSTLLMSFIMAADGLSHNLKVEMISWAGFETYYFGEASKGVTDEVFLTLDDTSGEIYSEPLAAGAHKMALTIIDGKISACLDGGAVITINPATSWAVAPNFVVLAAKRATVEDIGFYPAQDDADLPALSAL